MKKAYFNWSSGKDSALALYVILQDKNYKVSQLLTNVNKNFDRVSMHGLREDLLDAQAESIGLPLQKIYLPGDITMQQYDEIMKKTMTEIVQKGYKYAVFGDIFLEDLKKYREDRLAEIGLQGVFPLWKKDTKELLQEFLDLGFKAITVCVNAKLLDESFVGRVIDQKFINDLPENVDVCGENGEFHTFVYDGPIFQQPVSFTVGEKVLRTYQANKEKDDNCFQDKKKQRTWDTGFWYCDLIPDNK